MPAVMLALLCLLAAGLSVALVGSVEVAMAAARHEDTAAGYVSQAFLERAIADLRWIVNWNLVLDGTIRSGLTDGAPSGTRALPMGLATIDLDALRHLASCGHREPCSVAELNAVTSDRPWGPNNPRWRLFVYAPASALLPAGRIVAPFYGVVLVADDGGEEDGNPEADGAAGTRGAGIVWLRSLAVGATGSRTSVEAAVERPVVSGSVVVGRPLRLRSWIRRPTVPGGF